MMKEGQRMARKIVWGTVVVALALVIVFIGFLYVRNRMLMAEIE